MADRKMTVAERVEACLFGNVRYREGNFEDLRVASHELGITEDEVKELLKQEAEEKLHGRDG